MVQSEKEIALLGIGSIVKELYRAATLEGKTLEDCEYNEHCKYNNGNDGKITAYRVVYVLLQRDSGLDEEEFDRRIDELRASETLHLRDKPNGKYELLYVDGGITSIFPSSQDQQK